ncbi:uncharacterized protein LOC144362663 [Saccoglossus kowalevskii]
MTAYYQFPGKASKSKYRKELLVWATAVRHHFWHASKECGDDEGEMKAIWFGILHHVVNEHEWLLNVDSTYGGCAHKLLSEENQCKLWLKKGSPACLSLRNIVEDKHLLEQLGQYTNFRYWFLGGFHSHMLMYAPKRYSFRFVGYKARTKLAAIDFNMHAERNQ